MAMPRNFKILEEMEQDGKNAGISYGLKKQDDIELRDFEAMVIDKHGIISNFEIHCSNEYPKKPPTVMIVDSDNDNVWALFSDSVLKSACQVIKDWTVESSMADILLYIQKKA